MLQHSRPRLLTAAAWRGLGPAPESRSRGAYPHLPRSLSTRSISSCRTPFRVRLRHTLDGPVRPRQRQQLRWLGLFGVQAGDRTHGLDSLSAAHDAFPRDAADLRRPLPLRCQQIAQRGGRLNPAGFDPAMTFLDGFRLSQVRRGVRGVEGENGRKACSISAFSAGWFALTVKK